MGLVAVEDNNRNNCVKGYPIAGGTLGGTLAGLWPMAAKPCDLCRSASALLYCKPDSAFLCVACDTRIHAVNKVASKHERLWMCEVCEQVPASVTCKADAAALCVSCDSDIHSANPLSRKHDRVPLVPFYESAESIIKKSSTISNSNNANHNLMNFLVPEEEEGQQAPNLVEDDVAWLLPPQKAEENTEVGKMYFGEFAQLLDFESPNQVYLNFKTNQQMSGTDSVVPVQVKPEQRLFTTNSSSDRCFDIDFCKSKLPVFQFESSNLNSHSINHSVSSSSIDIGLVPDGGSDNSYSFGKQGGESQCTADNSTAAAVATQLTGLDREARVLRYREKRKNRKFEKTIRYASRKAYAETRPRIKGRFVKRTEPDQDMDVDHRILFGGGSIDFLEGYGVVPSY